MTNSEHEAVKPLLSEIEQIRNTMTISQQARKAASLLGYEQEPKLQREVGEIIQEAINESAKPLREVLERISQESREWPITNIAEVALAQWRKENGRKDKP